jgi:dihydroxy-acid dehydratase
MTKPHAKTADSLRSARWFAPDDMRSMGHRSRFMQMGYGPEDWVGKPVIAIVNAWVSHSLRSAFSSANQSACR